MSLMGVSKCNTSHRIGISESFWVRHDGDGALVATSTGAYSFVIRSMIPTFIEQLDLSTKIDIRKWLMDISLFQFHQGIPIYVNWLYLIRVTVTSCFNSYHKYTMKYHHYILLLTYDYAFP